MRRRVTLIVAAALCAAWYIALPPQAVEVQATVGVPPAVRGVIHVHTRRSDGTGTLDSVAAEAARAGLHFVVFTDHGNATRAPEPPSYRSGVLCIDAVEISTQHGHVVALKLPKAPYPLAGESRDVVDDIHRLGGVAIAAHPASPRAELAWTDWTPPVDGFEWLNGDSEWRDEHVWSVARVLLSYPGRSAETLATLFDRPQALLRRWDRLASRRPVVALAAADAHARIELRRIGEPYETRGALHLPSYETIFRTFSIGVTDVTLGGNAGVDADAVLDAIVGGRVFSTIDALAGPGAISFSGASGAHRAVMGGRLTLDGPAVLHVAVQAPPSAQIVLLQDGAEIAVADAATTLVHEGSSDPGVYRVEVRVPGAPGQPPVPWLLSNAIYAGLPAGPLLVDDPAATAQATVRYDNGPPEGWTVETGAESRGAVDRLQVAGGDAIGFRFALGGVMSASPYSALVTPVGPGLDLAHYDRLLFTARASRPMRVSVQLRALALDGGGEERWHRSVYVDETPRPISVLFSEMTPRGAVSQPRPPLGRISSVLFVVDTLNADTGSNGQFTIDDVKYAR